MRRIKQKTPRKRSYTKKRKCFFHRIKKTRRQQQKQRMQRGAGGISSPTNIVSIPGHPLLTTKELEELQGDPESSDAAA